MYLPNHAFYSRNRPVVPLPNPGEGGPVYPGPDASTPVIPLPNPGEGGPVYPGPDASTPVIPLPNPGEGGPVYPGPDASTPVIPLPNPGEGGPVYPGPPSVSWPNLCYYCTAGRNAAVRFLNAAEGYNPFRVFLNNNLIVNSLSFGALTPYGRVTNGYQMVTVTGPDGYIYLQKSLPFRADSQYTVAVTKTASGLDLTQITDDSCPHPENLSCLRLCNLAYNSNPLDLLLANGRVIYTDVRFRESTPFKRIRPGDHQFYLAETGQYAAPYLGTVDLVDNSAEVYPLSELLVSFYLTVRSNISYTIFVLSRGSTPDAIGLLAVEDS